MTDHSAQPEEQFLERLSARGFRFTSQREHVFKVLHSQLDHPTAEQVFLRAKQAMPEISMATVYNCLDALVQCRLVKEVHLDRDASRYCPNMREHYHFFCSNCGEVYDIDLDDPAIHPPLELPEGFLPTGYDIAVRGLCPECGRGQLGSKTPSRAASKSV